MPPKIVRGTFTDLLQIEPGILNIYEELGSIKNSKWPQRTRRTANQGFNHFNRRFSMAYFRSEWSPLEVFEQNTNLLTELTDGMKEHTQTHLPHKAGLACDVLSRSVDIWLNLNSIPQIRVYTVGS